MDETSDGQAAQDFLATVRRGEHCSGTVTKVTRDGDVVVALDGFPGRPLGVVGPLDVSWTRFARTNREVEVGQRVTAEVIAVDREAGRVRMSMAATENPQLWAFLKGLRYGEIVSGVIASIESFGVFVRLDEGPGHPAFPGVGFISYAALSWHRFDAASDIVQVGQRVSCEFLRFDTSNGEARLSLKAMQPDPFQVFADTAREGQVLCGRVTKLVPFGVFVEVADGVEGLVHLREPTEAPVETPEEVVRVGEELSVVVLEVDRGQRRLTLARQQVLPDIR
ncbi:S1 RNA-binding domain-containing protein [Nocardiopsis algeriensis]|uniref:Small subunit ribosomal protein S1 n=1 Tax=Nocardiopsis algeriensis TaxID=1478215 RepID=A0A841IPC9_9ACTN|nr:S1 RNA-binding domain-containing protein [Nocardiopsis algeriensis]MBB6118545.1 small subunit ribosomal protein S1 [Nocardiopsis algeriensis]